MACIAATLSDKRVVDALAIDRARKYPREAEGQMRKEIGARADMAVALIEKYDTGGAHAAVLGKLKRLRNQHLAHRQTDAAIVKIDATAKEIESFYQDMSELISLLLSLVLALAYDPKDAGEVYRHHAKLFWAGVRGERTEGHPNYRALRTT
jgi:hypothetical protein